MLRNIIAIAGALATASCSSYVTKYGNTFEGSGDHHYFVPGAEGTGAWRAKYVRDSAEHFQPEDYISINLKAAYFAEFTEGTFKRSVNALSALTPGGALPVKGEIAIIVNVGDGEGLEQLADASAADNPGRVVFFSKDIYQGQHINQSFGAVYGPVRWSGNPITIDITVIEMDQEENAQLQGVLTALAKIGTSASSVASGKVLGVLNQVGAAFTYSNRDDIMGRYRLTLVPSKGGHDAALPVLQEGDLIVTRSAERAVPIDWTNVCYNDADARVTVPKVGAKSCTDDPAFNYLVFTVGRNLGDQDLTPELKLAGLSEAIKASSSVQQVRDAAQKVASVVAQEATFRKVKRSLQAMSSEATVSAIRSLEANVVATAVQCAYLAAKGDALGAQESDVGKLCGEHFHDDSLTPSELDHITRRLVTMPNCVAPDALRDDTFTGGEGADLEAARISFAAALAHCGET